jgi:hypothetical protein
MSEQVTVPDWILTLVGRLTLENEGLRLALAEAERTPHTSPDSGAASAPRRLEGTV